MKKELFIIIFMLLACIGYTQTPITATIAYQGYEETQAYLGQAEYQIFMDNTDNVLDKPIILIDGFDPVDSRNIAEMYALLDYNGNNIADQLRAEGFDFVLLNFPTYTRISDQVVVNGGGDYIQRSAMVLVELINQINAQKVGTEELVVIGPSMGGLISRYALSYMEQNSLAHQTRLFVSWDAPHKGANLPINTQYLLNYFAESQNNQDLKDAIATTINSPASKEMLLDHYLAHLQNGSTFLQDPTLLLPEGAPNFRNTFQTELDALGFPQQTRNISISNGSAIGTMTGSPGIEVLNDIFDVPNIPFTTVEIALHFTPAAGQTNEVSKAITRVFGATQASFTANSESFAYTDGVDSAPGGTRDIQTLIGGVQGNPLLTDVINAITQSNFCFIPTISAMAISNENDWYANIDIPNTHTSPFVAWYIPSTNESHVTPTQENVDFLLPEIRNQVATISDNILQKKYRLKSNPIHNELIILLDNNFKYPKIDVSVYSVNGQQLIETTSTNINTELRIPISLEKGIYFLEIKEAKSSFVQKLVVN